MTQELGGALALAIRFHETYERLAPSFGYETRADTKVFDPESKNGRLMVAVCAALASAPAEREPVTWMDEIEQRLLTWRQRTMNRSGDCLALDDFMGQDSIDDLVDFVCAPLAAPSPSADPAEQAPSVGQLRYTADRLAELAVREGMFSDWAIAERTKLWAMFDALAAQPKENGTEGPR